MRLKKGWNLQHLSRYAQVNVWRSTPFVAQPAHSKCLACPRLGCWPGDDENAQFCKYKAYINDFAQGEGQRKQEVEQKPEFNSWSLTVYTAAVIDNDLNLNLVRWN